MKTFGVLDMRNKKYLMMGLLFLFYAFTLLFISQQAQSQRSYYQLHNPLVQGWLFGQDACFAGERTWGYSGTKDTLLITKVDTTCIVILTAKTTQIENLFYDIKSAGDTVFVSADSAGVAATDKYSYLIIRNGYGATD